MDPILLFVGFTIAAATGLMVVYTYQRATLTQRVARARVIARQDRGAPSSDASALRQERRSAMPVIDGLPLSPAARLRMEWELDRAGLPLRVNEFLALRIASAFGGLIVGLLVAGRLGLPASLVAVSGFVLLFGGWMLPRAWVSLKRKRRLEMVERQLPIALTTLAKSLRAGTGLMQAIAYTADETPAPLGQELDQTLRELHLGANAEDAFSELADRVGSNDLDIAVTAIVIQRTVGGNLSEILTNVATTIRERAKLYGEIKVLTSRQRVTGWLMSLIPVLVAIAFLTLNPDLGRLLIDTTPGRISLAIGIGFEVLGLVLIRKFGQIDV